jgi:hypothetical protein
MKRRRSIKPPEWVAEHPPKSCRPLIAKRTLELLDRIKNGTLTEKEKPANEG